MCLTGTCDCQLVLFRKLIHSQNGNDILSNSKRTSNSKQEQTSPQLVQISHLFTSPARTCSLARFSACFGRCRSVLRSRGFTATRPSARADKSRCPTMDGSSIRDLQICWDAGVVFANSSLQKTSRFFKFARFGGRLATAETQKHILQGMCIVGLWKPVTKLQIQVSGADVESKGSTAG